MALDLSDSAKDIPNPSQTAVKNFACNENSNSFFQSKVAEESHSSQKPAGDHSQNLGVTQSGNFVPESTAATASKGPENSFDSGKQSMSFSMTPEQIKCPVIIEIFCGSGRVTASLKFLGLSACFGVDHVLDKTFTSAKQLDLTLKEHQDKLFLWLRSPLVVGVFVAPPCGTCSLARNIQLRDSLGRVLPGPRPLIFSVSRRTSTFDSNRTDQSFSSKQVI